MSDQPDGHLRYAVVIPTLGRPSLDRVLRSLDAQTGWAAPAEVIVVDDRAHGPATKPLQPVWDAQPDQRFLVLRSYGRGPAAARNVGWRTATADWIAFLDDDVELLPDWAVALAEDLQACGPDVAGTQGRIHVPLPRDRRPTDWERGTAGLQDASWATADMAYRRSVLAEAGGFDERFPRAYREDADLAIRVQRAGWRLVRGQRVTEHPVRPAHDWVSLRVQRGNADDVLMRALHGPRWRTLGGVPSGRLPWHVATVAAGVAAAGAAATQRPRPGLLAASVWGALTAEFIVRRLRPGPRPGEQMWWPETRRMVLTSIAIPLAAVVHRVRAHWRWRGSVEAWPLPPKAVLFDRDGTLVHDVPYNGNPAAVRLVPGAQAAVRAVRDAGLRTGVISNQSGIARGLITHADAEAVNQEIDQQLGGVDTWQICPHGDDDRCACRKPAPLMIQRAAAELGVMPQECVVIGDIGTDVAAAQAAGARCVLVPTRQTRSDEIADAPLIAADLASAVQIALKPPAEHRQHSQPAIARTWR